MIGGIRFFLGIETRIEEDEEKEKEIKVDEVNQHLSKPLGRVHE